MFSPSSHFDTRETPLRTYEKTGILIELGEQITNIRYELTDLSKTRRDMPMRDLHIRMETVDELVDHLLSRTITLAEPRGVGVKSMLHKAPKLAAEGEFGVAYDDWYVYILQWMQLILRALDEAQLLLTEESPQPDWTTPLLEDARGIAWEGVEENG